MYIENNEELRSLIPNVLREIEGEKTLYDKLMPYMTAVEAELSVYVIGEATVPDTLTGTIKSYVANMSYWKAVPNLDLILTPNGFGIVSNDNVAPASKERVAALRESLLQTANKAMVTICNGLMNVEAAEIHRLQKMSVFPRMEVIYKFYKKEEPMDIIRTYEDVQRMFAVRENRMAERYISQPVMQELRKRARGEHVEYDSDADSLLLMMQDIEMQDIRDAKEDLIGDLFPEKELRQMVDMVRKSQYKEIWESSPTGKAWNVGPYQNDEKSGGYWL